MSLESEDDGLATSFALEWNEAKGDFIRECQACRRLVIWLAMSRSDAELRNLKRAAEHAFGKNIYASEED